MWTHVAQVRWALVLKTAALIYIVTLILGLAVTYALLPFINLSYLLGLPGTVRDISLVTGCFVASVTGYGAFRVARRIDRAALLHGVLVGMAVALVSLLLDVLFLRGIGLVGLILYVLMVAAGMIGGVLGGRRRGQ